MKYFITMSFRMEEFKILNIYCLTIHLPLMQVENPVFIIRVLMYFEKFYCLRL